MEQQNNFLQSNSKNSLRILTFVITAVLTALIVGLGVHYWQNLKIKKVEIIRTTELFPVYGSNKNVTNKEINFYIRIPKSLALIEKLKIVAHKLSRFKFDYLPIEVLKIKSQNSNKIVVVNLRENNWNQNIDWSNPHFLNGNAGITWRAHHFQGSAGGHFTTITLTETFLQKEYKGDWIDGIIFLYENEPIRADHVFLSGTIYRK